ncbi:MAG: class I SAM-dependent methyltransferase [Planctomycetota bacterium]
MKPHWTEIPGWINENEGDALFKYASEIPEAGCIVEIGSWMGKSTIALALGLKTKLKYNENLIFAVDPHRDTSTHNKFNVSDTFEEFNKNISKFKVADIVQPIKSTSEEFAKGWTARISLLFVDGEHTYESVKQDLGLWLPFLIKNGIVMCHDYDGGTPGVVKAVQEMMPGSKYVWLPRVGSLFIGRKI